MTASFKDYFLQTERIQQYLGKNKITSDAAEILLYISSMTSYGEKVSLDTILKWLFLPTGVTNMAIRFLKDKDLIKTKGKCYIINEAGIDNLSLTPDEKVNFHSQLHSLDEWYSKKNEEVRYQWLSYIHGISEADGLETKHCTRRLLARCLCFNECSGCSQPTSLIIKRDMKRRLNKEIISELVERDTYVSEIIKNEQEIVISDGEKGITYVWFLSNVEIDDNSLTHKHHIIPRSEGGTDHPSNIIRLTPAQHAYAHILYDREHGTYTSGLFLGKMHYCRKDLGKITYNDCLKYNTIEEQRIKNSKKVVSSSLKAYWSDPENRRKISSYWEGRTHSEETKMKMSEAHKGLIWINNGKERRRIHKDDPIPEGWKLGKKF